MKKKFTRRDFLKAASLATASALALSCGAVTDAIPPASPTKEFTKMPAAQKPTEVKVTSAPTEDTRPRQADVIVIGAGIAGLAAARSLTDNGWSVIVLEARERIGGRLWTDSSLGLPLDLGASWIHGARGNPITALANQFGAETLQTDYENGVVYDADGNEISDKEYAQMENLFETIYAQVEGMQEDEDNDMSLQQAFERVIKRRNLSAEQLHQLQFVIEGEFALELGADPNQLSLWEWDQDEEFGGADVIFPRGYSQIAEGLAQGLDIRLGVKVNSVSYDQTGVDVETSAGGFSGDKTVVTIPLGVLKKNGVRFDPPLPAKKQQAIEKLGMGVLNKVYLKFPRMFWDEGVEGISYVGARVGEWCDWLSFAPYVNEPVLLAFHGGAMGFALEDLSDAEIIAGAMKTLRVIYGDDIPDPSGYLITRWGKDPFAFGAYSHVPPFASGKDYDLLAAPVADVLFFAGEATSRKYPATAHGAYLSGLRAAEELENL